MHEELQEYLNEIGRNKKDGKGYCSSCRLQGDYGPALIECASDSPEVVVVSESPMTESLDYIKDMTDNSWTRWILRGCDKGREARISSAGTMGRFVGGLTGGRVYNVCDETKTHGLYWTHTVKCFLQNEKNISTPVKQIKKDRAPEFRDAVEKCSNYLRHEMEKLNPKLIVAVGLSEAAKKLNAFGFSDRTCDVYHPAWPARHSARARKAGKLKTLCRRVEALNLQAILPGCVSSQ